ncbi:type I DNA topoisomerase [Candidatus Omnitrophota bacterium]
MGKGLVIVESPAKAKTINKFLGQDYTVQASGGHIMDLPKNKMGVDIDNDFLPEYTIIPARKKTISQIKAEAKKMDAVFLAADPDREGEAICWHLQQALNKGTKVYRVVFHEITERAVKAAFAHPGEIDMNKVEAQQARRVLDRLVGYSLSPLLWKKITRGLSAGRVQSVAVRLIVERERAIGHFLPQEYWELEAELKKKQAKDTFLTKLDKISGKKPEISNQEQIERLLEEVRKQTFVVTDIRQREKKRNPQAPLITSKLQQEAYNQLHFTAHRTMLIAQQLYEGLELGDLGSVGLISYMRTDSVRVSQDGQVAAREYINGKYGKNYLPLKPPQYKSKKSAQQAHEAIRPTLPLHEPEAIKQYLTSDQYKLYSLIWNKFLSSQMRPAVYTVTTILITAGEFLFKTTGSSLKFDGCLRVFRESSPEDIKEESAAALPNLSKDELLDLVKLNPSQHFTQPPPRFTDASLVKILEEKGIGRPSTYAPIMRTIVMRDYIRRESGHFFPTDLGFTVNDMLIKYFSKILDAKFTATLEENLDQIEEGKLARAEVIKLFYAPFIKELELAQKKIKKEVIPTKEVCELCGRPMVVKWGRHGRFLSCSGFPECKHAKSITTEVRCPEDGCGGWLVQRRTKRGKFFYGCSNYPKCTHISNKLPEAEKKEEDGPVHQ